MKVLYPITLDVKKTNIQKHIKAFTSEGGTRELIITLVSGNDTIELTNGYVVSVVGVKPDGTEFANTATVSDGKIHYTLTTQNVAVEGEVDCHIRVVKTNELLYTSKFAIDVEKNLSDEETETSSNEWTELIDALNRVNNMSVIWTGEGAPSTDPEEYPDIQESNFYFDETNKEFYYAKAVGLTITWDKIVDYTTLVAELSSKQDELTAGDGIDLTDDTVSVDLDDGGQGGTNLLSFRSNKLSLTNYDIGYNADVRVALTEGANPLASKAYVDSKLVKSNNTPPEQSTTKDYAEGTLWVHQATPYHSYLLTRISFNSPYYRYEWLDLGKLVSETNFNNLFDLSMQDIVSDGLDYDGETGLSVWLDNNSLLSFTSEGALKLTGDTIANDSTFKTTLGSYVYTETEVDNLLAAKQALIDSSHKLSADLLSDGTTNKTVTTSEKSTWNGKQDKLTAGTNITIDSNNVISATGGSGGSYTAGDGIDISNNEISVKLYNSQDNGLMFNSDGTLALFKSVLARDSSFRSYLAETSTQNPLQPKLTAGTNITIDSNNVISASGGGFSYTFTDGLTESSGTVGIDLASGSKLLIDSNDKLDIDLTDYATQTDLADKQDTIDSTHKLSADLVDDTNSTNKFTTSAQQTSWTNKADNTTITTDTTSTTVSLTLADNNEYRYTQELTSLTLTMPSGDFIASVVFSSGSTPTSMTYDSSIKWSGDDITNGQFVPQASKTYNIVFWYDGININAISRSA